MHLALLPLLGALGALLPAAVRSVPVFASADGVTRPYTLFNNAFGATAYEVPDCNHTAFGDHITQQLDPDLARWVFLFHLHVDFDDDRCIRFDRQRNEIKTYAPSPAYLKAQEGETVAYSWNFRLSAGVQMSKEFTHIHQVKYSGGNDVHPLYTISLVKKPNGDNVLRYIHTDNEAVRTTLIELPIYPFYDTWVHVYERINFSKWGSVFVNVTRVSDGAQLFSYQGSNIDSWRDDTNFCRPKWGFYRSVIETKPEVRDEIIRFDRFCIAKAEGDTVNDDCERLYK